MDHQGEPRPAITRQQIARDLAALGFGPGQLVFVHSSLSSLGSVEGGADAVIDAFLDVLGPTGTLAVPTLVQKPPDVAERFRLWDPATKPSDVGLITETLRRRPGAHRSNHPTHSIAAVGARAAELTREHELSAPRPCHWGEHAFGGDSPWERLARWGARYTMLGVDFKVCTLFHYVQAVFTAEHLARLGPEPPWPSFDFRGMGEAAEAAGLVRVGRCGEAAVRIADAGDLVRFALDELGEHPERWLSLDPATPFGAWWSAHGDSTHRMDTMHEDR